ncbi:nucleotide exchange factor GrpE, partial [Candidatus Peregrinibacteria bacterium CG_4_9_14_0_2_um_filter_53_11]
MGDDSTAQDVSAAQDEQTVELDLDQLRLELQEAQTNIDQLTETSKRALADLQNYRRRVEEERAHMSRFATAGLLRDLLPVIDNFHRASTHNRQEVR